MLLSNQEAEAVSILYLPDNDANVSSLGYKYRESKVISKALLTIRCQSLECFSKKLHHATLVRFKFGAKLQPTLSCLYT
jgi:hypothetical protein